MNAIQYIEFLWSLDLKIEHLVAAGFEKGWAQPFYNDFHPKKSRHETLEPNPNPILDLVLNFQSHNEHVFFGFSFDDPSFYEPINHRRSDIFLFGTFDTDGLALSYLDNQIIVLDHDDCYGSKFYECSKNGFHFLDAIAIFREYQFHVLVDPTKQFIKNKNIARVYANRACQAAGGDKYMMFYLALFDCYTDEDIMKYSL